MNATSIHVCEAQWDTRSVLLNSALDALDRLFDSESGVIDIHAIIYATSQALTRDPLFSLLDEAAKGLATLVRDALPGRDARERALDITNELRVALARALP